MVPVTFWLLGLALVWTYVGYWIFMEAYARFRPRPLRDAADAREPTTAVVIAARNEGAGIARRLANLLVDCEPSGLREVIVVCNGCSDETLQEVGRVARSDARVRVLTSPPEAGKAGALNLGVEHARGEIIVFADARQRYAPDALRRLVAPFRDPEVGAVTGRLVIHRSDRPALTGLRWYWGVETRLRLAESRTGSVVGATGAIYAVRRELFPTLPPGLILDDVYVPMRIAMRRYRVVMAPEAVAMDLPTATPALEYRRRVRTLVGNLQLVRFLPELLSPVRNPLFLRFVSHKLLRLATPLCFLAMLALALLIPGILYKAFAGMLLFFFALGGAGLVLRIRALAIPAAFVLLLTAALSAVLRPSRSSVQLWTR